MSLLVGYNMGKTNFNVYLGEGELLWNAKRKRLQKTYLVVYI